MRHDRLIADQVMSSGGMSLRPPANRGLRNTLGFLAPNVATVVLHTDADVAEAAVGYESDTRRFRFRGDAYELTMATQSARE